ncbi:S-adenosyl-L-methionine-dependent methyltransferase [Suillus occidentalis]|nr:S-adenosyl-L-methionine-dependent methyltransferase [Suillus occidentalis]
MLRSALSCNHRRCPRQIHLKVYFSSTALTANNKPPPKHNDKINYNPDISFSNTVDPKHLQYPMLSSRDLESHRKPPTRVRMLIRDFIEDSLYNPHYGYFSKRATIFTAPPHCGGVEGGFDFNKYRDSAEFEVDVAKRYREFGNGEEDGPGRQLWHTPTELFKPWYGQAIAQCLVSEYLLKYFPYEDFKVYELGAGNGTLALNILDFLKTHYPEVYDRTQYTIIEISEKLARAQRHRLYQQGHGQVVEVVNRSVFQWERKEHAPCYVVAAEVVDNFAHDVVRYDLKTLEAYQGVVAVDEVGEFVPFYTKISDPLIASYLALRRRLSLPVPLPRFLRSPSLRRVYASLPFAPNLSPPDYIPTRLLSLLKILRTHFPRHRLLLSDFSSLPDAVPGLNAPVVQTRVGTTMVPCGSVFVQQGWFDIMFPTDFTALREMYEFLLSQAGPDADEQDELSYARVSPLASSTSPLSLGAGFFSSRARRSPLDGVTSASGLPVGERKSSVFSHAEYLETYADLGKTRLVNGENPMVGFYENVKVLF